MNRNRRKRRVVVRYRIDISKTGKVDDCEMLTYHDGPETDARQFARVIMRDLQLECKDAKVWMGWICCGDMCMRRELIT